MDRRHSENYIEYQQPFTNGQDLIDPIGEIQYGGYEVEKRIPILDFDHNYYLPEEPIDQNMIKKEEELMCSENPEQLYFNQQEYYQNQKMLECLSLALKIPIDIIDSMQQTNPYSFQKLFEKAKRALKREKAKLRQKMRHQLDPTKKEIEMKQEEPEILSKKKPSIKSKNKCNKDKIEKEKIEETEPTFSEKESYPTPKVSISEAPTENDKQQKKIVQMIRNRISAQNSRDKKKAYIHQLEANSQEIKSQNQLLKQKLTELQNKEAYLTKKNTSLKQQIMQVKDGLMKAKSLNTLEFGIQDKLQSKESTTSKSSFGKIGLALLTMVSVFMMVTGKDHTSHTSTISQEEGSSLLQMDKSSHLFTLPSFLINESHSFEKISEKQMLKQMEVVRKQLKEYVNEVQLFKPDLLTSLLDDDDPHQSSISVNHIYHESTDDCKIAFPKKELL